MTMPHGRAVDLGAVKAAADGDLPFPVILTSMLSQLVSEVRGIRVAVSPSDAKHHVPVVTPVVSKDGEEKGFGVYCIACSDAEGDYVQRCRLVKEDDTDWPPTVLVPLSGTSETPTTASPDVPDFPPDTAEG